MSVAKRRIAVAHYKSYNEKNKPAHCLAECIYCGETHEKKYMNCLMLRENCWATPKVIGYLCPDCKSNMYERLEIRE